MLNKFMDDKQQTISVHDDFRRDSKKKIIPVQQIQQINRKTEAYNKKNINYDDRPTVPSRQNYMDQQLKHRVEQLQNQLQFMKQQYQAKIDELNAKANQKNDFFLNLIQQMQERHSEQILYYQNMLQSYQQQKKQMASIQAKMNQIGAGIQDILVQSSQLSRMNEELDAQLKQKQRIIQQLRKQLQKNSQHMGQYQQTIDEAEKMKLKAAKRTKDLIQLIDQAEKEIEKLTTSSLKKQQNGKQLCASTRIPVKNCQHCKLSHLSDKYSKMVDEQ